MAVFLTFNNAIFDAFLGNFKIQMEIKESNLFIREKQMQCRTLKQNNFDSSSSFVPKDSTLQLLLMRIPSSPPFIIQKKTQFNHQKNHDKVKSYGIHQKILNYNRKQRSLQQLSKKFLQKFQGKNQKNLELDKVTYDLGVQRRRIYDIINILQSLGVVVKKCKNNYQWKGLAQAVKTIQKCQIDPDSVKIQKRKKQKSLQYLANSFLKLFLKQPAITLEVASKQIIKDSCQEVIRTKIRRLYDIVNVFKSLHLVKKTLLGPKKPGFIWLGTKYLINYILQRDERNESKIQIKDQNEFKKNDSEKQNICGYQNSFLMNVIGEKIGVYNLDDLSQLFKGQIFPQKELEIPQNRTGIQENIFDDKKRENRIRREKLQNLRIYQN